MEYLPSLTPSEHGQVRYYACGTFEDGQGDKAYMVVSGWADDSGFEYESGTEVLFQHANAWVPGPPVPHSNSKPWTTFATGYNLTPDRVLLVYGSEFDYNHNEYSEVFQLSPDAKSWLEMGTIERQYFGAAAANLTHLCN